VRLGPEWKNAGGIKGIGDWGMQVDWALIEERLYFCSI
jgi:hypothetical protein